MAKLTVNIGTSANDRTGDNLRTAFDKINQNFDELYTTLGLDDNSLNLGAFEFTGSVMTTTDSSAITIDQQVTVSSDLNVGGDIVPNTDLGSSLGSATKRWKDLYVSSNTIYIGNTTLGVSSSGTLEVGGTSVSEVIDYNDIQNTPTIPTATSELTNDSGFITANDIPTDFKGSVFADDSTLLVDAVNGSISQSVIPELNDSEVRIGSRAGDQSTDTTFVAIGSDAGRYAGNQSIAIGRLAGGAGANAISIGASCGTTNQGNQGIAIGYSSGRDNQGNYGIALGFRAGQDLQHDNTIIINADSGVASLDSEGTNRLYINPIREAAGTYTLQYNPTNYEVTYELLESDYKSEVDVTLSDAYGSPADGYSDIPISSDTSKERFRLVNTLGTNAVDLPDLTDAEFGKEVYIYSDGTGAGSSNMVVTFTYHTGISTHTFGASVFGAKKFTWYGSYWWTENAG